RLSREPIDAGAVIRAGRVNVDGSDFQRRSRVDWLARAAGGSVARSGAVHHCGRNIAATGAAGIASDIVAGVVGGSGIGDGKLAEVGRSKVWIRDAWAFDSASGTGFGGLLAGAACDVV